MSKKSKSSSKKRSWSIAQIPEKKSGKAKTWSEITFNRAFLFKVNYNPKNKLINFDVGK